MRFGWSAYRVPRRLVAGLMTALIVFLEAGSARAQSAPEVRATVLMRALAFDRRLKARAGDSLTLAVVFLANDRASSAAKVEMLAALSSLTAQKLEGLPLNIVEHSYTSEGGLAAAIKQGYDVLYIAPGLGSELGAIQQASRRAQVPTLTGERDYVEQGLSLGVSIVGGRPKLVVNVEASKAEGMDLSSQMLQLAEIIR